MIKRILPFFIIILCVVWSTFISIELLSGENTEDFKHYFNKEDHQLLVIHHGEEIDWNSENFQILPSNQTLALSLLPKLKNKASLFISSKRPLFIIEKKDNWTEQAVSKLLSNGIFKFEFTGRKSFKFGEFNGNYLNHQLVLYKGKIDFTSINFRNIDEKASYSIVDFDDNQTITTDVYQKEDKTYRYKHKLVKTTNAQVKDDKKLFSSIIPSNFTEYIFYETHFLEESDPVFKKSDFRKWVKNGIVVLSNGTSKVALFDFKEGQNPIQNLNEKYNIEEKNETMGIFEKLDFSSLLAEETHLPLPYFVVELDDICLVSTNKQYLEEILTEINLGKSISQNEDKLNSVFANLPAKVVFRNVSGSKLNATSIFRNTLIETNCVKKDVVSKAKQTKVKDYFSMNPGERILDFITFNGRGNLLLLTESNKLICYTNGSKRWEKVLTSKPTQFSLFSFQNNQITLGIGNELQIIDINGRIIYRFPSTSSVSPNTNFINGKEVFLVANTPRSISVMNTKGKTLKTLRTNEDIKKIVSYQNRNKLFCGLQTGSFLYHVEIAKKSPLLKINVDSLTQVFAGKDNLYVCSVVAGNLSIQAVNGAKTSTKVKQNTQLLSSYSENNQQYFLLKQDKKLVAVDVNGRKAWERNLEIEDLSSVNVSVNQQGKNIIGVLDAIENRLYLYDSKGNILDDSERHGEQKLEISPFGSSAFSITTFLGTYLIQYTKL